MGDEVRLLAVVGRLDITEDGADEGFLLLDKALGMAVDSGSDGEVVGVTEGMLLLARLGFDESLELP